MDLTEFADEVGATDPVTITGLGTRGGPVPGVRVGATTVWHRMDPGRRDDRCDAARARRSTTVDAALAEVGQCVALPPGGTVGGALSVGRSGIRRLGYGPVRDVLLQANYVSDGGEVVQAGGPTVKNVSGFDLCRLLVGARGTLGFLGDVIIRSRPRPPHSQWFTTETDDPFPMFAKLYRPASVLVERLTPVGAAGGSSRRCRSAGGGVRRSTACDGPPELPSGSRRVVRTGSGRFADRRLRGRGRCRRRPPCRTAVPAGTPPESSVTKLTRRIKAEFDPGGRLNPGVSLG